MTQEVGPRKLAAIMSIDVVGFSAMTEIDESGAAAVVARLRSVLDTIVGGYGGRIFNTAGDGFMLEFASAAGALAAAELIWSGVERKKVRVGVHVGDVLVAQNGDLIGHSVNIAARLQQLAQPGSVVVSMDVRRAVRGKLCLAFPDTYALGMSHHGLQVLYSVMNDDPRWACERAFTPWLDFEAELRRAGLPLYSLETFTPLRVPSACHAAKRMVLPTNRTEPSARATLTPPGW